MIRSNIFILLSCFSLDEEEYEIGERGAEGGDEDDGEYDPGSEADQSDDENGEDFEDGNDEHDADGDDSKSLDEPELNQSHATPPAMSPDVEEQHDDRPPSKESVGTEESLSLQFSVDESSQQPLPESIRECYLCYFFFACDCGSGRS